MKVEEPQTLETEPLVVQTIRSSSRLPSRDSNIYRRRFAIFSQSFRPLVGPRIGDYPRRALPATWTFPGAGRPSVESYPIPTQQHLLYWQQVPRQTPAPQMFPSRPNGNACFNFSISMTRIILALLMLRK